MIFLLTQNSF